MKVVAILTIVVLALAAGCGQAETPSGPKGAIPYDPSTKVPADLPPSPSTWPPYPAFTQRSCWTRPFGRVERQPAPSYAPAPRKTALEPKEVVARFLSRFGDRRYIHSIAIGPVPALELRNWHSNFIVHPPEDALWATISVPRADRVGASKERPSEEMIAEWEAGLAEAALRDDFCAAGGSPLVGWTTPGIKGGLSSREYALGMRFPNPSPQQFRARVALVGRKYGFRVYSLTLLRPEQLAPLLVVESNRPRKAFVHDIPAIVSLLDPIDQAGSQAAETFEGFLLEARDARGVFVGVESLRRDEMEGGEWSWNRCVYPYAHSEPVGAKPCPSS
jgi:hypothetical protein